MPDADSPLLTDPNRLRALYGTFLLDSPVEEAFDRLTRLANRILKAPVAVVSLIDANREFCKSQVGLPEPLATDRNLPLSYSLCKHVVATQKPLIIDDTRLNPLVADNLAVLEMHVAAYAGMPLRLSTGEVIGSFCLIDTNPRHWTEDEIYVLSELTASVMTEIELHIELRERRQTEEALRASDARYRLLLDTATDAIVTIDSHKNIVFVNPATEKIFGYTADEMLGKPMTLLMPESVRDDYSVSLQGYMETGRKRRSWHAMEVNGLAKDGTEVPIEASFGEYKAGGESSFTAIIRDITQRRYFENALMESEGRYRIISELASDFSYCLELHEGSSPTPLWITGAFTQITGYSEADVATMGWFAIYPPESLAQYSQDRETLYRDGTLSGDMQILAKNGEKRWIRSVARLVRDEQGRPVRIYGTSQDITERKQLEEQLRKALKTEREASQLKSRFASMASHEFRTPLTAIQLAASVLAQFEDRLTKEAKLEKLNRIQAQIKHMTTLLDDMMIVIRSDHAGLEFHPEPLDLATLCKTILEELDLITVSHTIRYSESLDAGEVLLDPKLLRQAISNLVSNAVKYSPPGSVISLDLHSERVASPEGDHLQAVLRVEDQGIGIPEEDQKHLFELFYRAANVNNVPGTGLGLAIVKQAVEAHGGTMSYASQVGIGTSFTMCLPLVMAGEPTAAHR